MTFFDDGRRFLEARTGLLVLGVVSMLRGFALDQEDRVAMEGTHQRAFDATCVNSAVVLLPRMSNFTDFKPVAVEPDVRLCYVERPQDLAGGHLGLSKVFRAIGVDR